MLIATVVTMFPDGLSEAEIPADLPYLEREDIVESLRFAAEAVCERQVSPSPELEHLLTFASKGPLLASLVDGIIKLLLGDPPNRPLRHN